MIAIHFKINILKMITVMKVENEKCLKCVVVLYFII